MPYLSTSDLPPAVRRLPLHAQDIFVSALDSAWNSYANRDPPQQEEIALRVGWGTVKKHHRKQGENWIPRSC